MEKKVLLAVDGSSASLAAADYLGLMEAAVLDDLWVTVFHVMEPTPPGLRQDAALDPTAYNRLRALERRLERRGQEVLEQARERLLAQGLAPERVRVKAQQRQSGLARDILFEAERGLYDAVVLGRRGLSRLHQALVGSVTNKVVQHADRLPVWVVGGAMESRRVLCALDRSPGALAAVDHLGFMVGGNPRCQVTLFHVAPHLARLARLEHDAEDAERLARDMAAHDRRQMEAVLEQARAMLLEAGLDPSQIQHQEVSAPSVTKAILEAVALGGYGTVVLGRRGEGGAFWLGHVSDRLLAACDQASLWIVG